MNNIYILGINAYHGDSSACLIRDGILLCAAEEERFRRKKHWAGFPKYAISFCLEEAGINISDVSYIAINQNPFSNFFYKLLYLAGNKTSLKFLYYKFLNKRIRASIPDIINNSFSGKFTGDFYQVDHHISHLFSSFYVSPFKKSVVVSVDGFGDFSSTLIGIANGSKLEILRKVNFPHSLGIFYQAMTQWLGFDQYGDEYKVMGLAPYGKPNFLNKISYLVRLTPKGTFKLNLDYFLHHNHNVSHTWNDSTPVFGRLFSNNLIELLGPPRLKSDEITQKHMDIARSVQDIYEKALFHVLNYAYDISKIKNLCLAGGCAMNSVANGRIYSSTHFKKLYVQAAAGDAGGAIGAAYYVWNKIGGKRHFCMDHAYYGPEFDSSYIENLLDINSKIISRKFNVRFIESADLLCKVVAKSIAKGSVIGWFQGRMEWGPRALGNRSILGDPRRADMKDILNIKIKRRESFRPFAPSILEEHSDSWFESYDSVPFMMQVFQVKKNKRKIIPAVTHVDGSGRLQTVSKKTNSLYHLLITNFFELTSVPLLLNTSFNENEPIVCTPEEAFDCFVRTKMDMLVLGHFILTRKK